MRLLSILCAGALALGAGCDHATTKTHPPVVTPSGGVTQIVEPGQGGTVSVTEGVVAGSAVTIPKGAIDHPVEVTVGPGTSIDEVSLPAGPAIEVGPSGTEFMQPVTVELPYTEPLPPLGVGQESTTDDLVVTIRGAGGDLERKVPVRVDQARHLVRVETLHFSTFQAGVEPRADPAGSTLSADARSGLPTADGADAVTVRVVVKDAVGTSVEHAAVTLSVEGDGAQLSAAMLDTDAKGATIAQLTATSAGTKTVRASVVTARATFDLGPLAIEFASRSPVALRFDQQPTGGTAGVVLSPAVQVTLVDGAGRPVNGTDPVTVEVVGVAGALMGTTTVTPQRGVVTFSDLAVTHAGRGLQLRVSTPRLASLDSQLFDVAAGLPARVSFRTQPANGLAGAPLGPIRVELRDAFDNAAGGDQAISIELAGQPAGALGGTTSRPPMGGVATFEDLVVLRAGTAYRLVATAALLPDAPAMSAPFDVSHALAAALRVRAQPAGGVAGRALAPAFEVEAVDAFGNAAPDAMGTVTVVIAGSPAGVTLGGARLRGLVSGVATFGDLTIDRGGSYRLSATAPGLTQADGMAFTVTPGAPSQLAFRAPPSDGTVGTTLAVVVVEVQDALGNPTPGATGDVQLTLQNGAGATLAGTTSRALGAGEATFADLRIDRSGTGYALLAASGTLTAATSRAFAVGPGPATRLAMDALQASVAAGAAIAPPLQVRVLDAFGNLARTSTASIRMALGENPAGATLAGTTTVAATAGVASFPDLSLNRAGTGLTLVASSAGLSDATSGAFAVTPGASARLTLLGAPANGNTGAALPPLQVAIEDALGNRVTAAAGIVSVALAVNPASATLGGSTQATPSGGVATFASLSVNRPGQGYTLAFSSGTLPPAISTPFDVVAVAARLAFVVQPVSALFGIPLGGPVTVEVQDTLGNRVTSATNSITLALSSNPNAAQLLGTTVQPAVTGQTVFSAVALDRAGVGYTLSASAVGLVSATSGPFGGNQLIALDGLGHLDGLVMSFVRGNANDAVNARSFNDVEGLALDAVHHRLFVVEGLNHRVLVFNLSGTNDFSTDRVADFVIGQPDFQAAGTGLSQNRLKNPKGVIYDEVNDRLFVADTGNRRVLMFNTASPTSGMNAAAVIGQSDFTTADTATSQNQTSGPSGGCYDPSTNRLFVVDYAANRVLVFDATTVTNGMPASLVIGQATFTAFAAATAADRLGAPVGCAYGAGNRLFVSEAGNSRVTIFAGAVGTLATGASAQNVLGQPDFSSTGFAIAANRMGAPEDVAVSTSGVRLFVADTGAQRVLEFDLTTVSNGMNAVSVVGQSSFTAGGSASGPNRFSDTKGLAFDPQNGNLFIGERNHRVLQLAASTTLTVGQSAIDGLGHLDGTAMSFSRNQPNDSPSAQAFNDPSDTAIDATHHRLFVVDRQSSRVLVFLLSANDDLVGGAPGSERVADFVLGQPDFQGRSCGLSAATFCNPERVLYDPATDRLFVADNQQNRILVFDTATITNGMSASIVLGQSTFAGSGASTSATGLSDPWGMAIDPSAGRLFVADRQNHRVLGYPTASLATGMAATLVLGASDFSTATPATTQAGLRGPTDVAWDATGSRLFVADQANHRVTVYGGALASGMNATSVLGQADFVSSAQAHTATGMSFPVGLAIDASQNKLLVSDQSNGRVLVFKLGVAIPNGMPAATSIGESSFTGGAGSPQATLSIPNGLDAVGGRMWLADSNAHRVTLWNP